MEDRQWIRAIQKGNKEYLQDIAEKYYDDIYRFCAFQTGSRTDGYDLAQETFLRFIRYVENYRERNLKGYLLTIAMNVCRNYLREKAVERGVYGGEAFAGDETSDRIFPEVPVGIARGTAGGDCGGGEGDLPLVLGTSAPEQAAVKADVHDRLMRALAQLPETQREAILLHYMYDMKYREIGRLKGVTVSTVKSRVRQGMDKLRGTLEKEDFLDG